MLTKCYTIDFGELRFEALLAAKEIITIAAPLQLWFSYKFSFLAIVKNEIVRFHVIKNTLRKCVGEIWIFSE